MSAPRIVIIAGPNGAGKTTFAGEFLPNEAGCPIFVNADLIAAGLSPFAPELAAFKAGRLMLEAIGEHVARRESFAFETTLAGRTYGRMIPAWRQQGYVVKLISWPCRTRRWPLPASPRALPKAGIMSPRKSFAADSTPACAIFTAAISDW